MAKFHTIIIGILLAIQLLDFCDADFLLDFIGATSSVVGLGQFVFEMKQKLLTDGREVDEVLRTLQEFNKRVKDDMAEILYSLKDLSALLKYELRINDLAKSMIHIEGVFERVIRIKKNYVSKGRYELQNQQYEDLEREINKLEDHMHAITAQLTSTDTSLFRIDFTANLMKYENVCKIGKSNLQLLDTLLGTYKNIVAQYYITITYILDFLELKGDDNTNPKQWTKNQAKFDYTTTVRSLKKVMQNASLELWTCDPENGYNDASRYTNKKDPKFVELRIATNYTVSEENWFDTIRGCRDIKCSNIESLKQCLKDNKLCPKVRLCPGRLLHCNSYSENTIEICINKDKKAYQRYQSLVTWQEPATKFHCDENGDKTIVTTSAWNPLLRHRTSCHFCHCVCEEDEYYVDTLPAESDFESNKVVTGARLLVEENEYDKTLRLQIQQAQLLDNGIIDKTTLEWKPLEPVHLYLRERISFEEYKQFALTPVLKPDDEVVTGLGLYVKRSIKLINPPKMIFLYIKAKKFDFKSGKIYTSHENRSLNDQQEKDLMNYPWKFSVGYKPHEKFDLSDRDVPTKGTSTNKDYSTDDQYVELTLSSTSKDGGQSVIPFIDTQNVMANGPLSGAALYVKAQPDYGGFLGIKLMTFDIWKYVDEDVGL